VRNEKVSWRKPRTGTSATKLQAAATESRRKCLEGGMKSISVRMTPGGGSIRRLTAN